MVLLLALLPLAAAFTLVLSGRASIARAGCIGALIALIYVAFVTDGDAFARLFSAANSAGRGLWVAWQAISIIITGLFFQRVALTASPEAFAPAETPASEADARRQTFAAIFLLGVFVESASGFGLGAVAAVAVLQGSGLPRDKIAPLALLSLSLVPWGALAIGTQIASGLTDTPLSTLGADSAILSIPVLTAALTLFWFWAPGGFKPSAMLPEALWLTAMLTILYFTNRMGVVDLAGVIAGGALFALRWLIDRARARESLRAGPFAILAAALIALRLIPGITPALASLWTIQPWSDLHGFPPAAHAATWLIIIGILFGLAKGMPPRSIGTQAKAALKLAWIPTLVTAGFVVLGEGMSGAGSQTVIASAVAGALGESAGYATPIFAALAGWLTGSNAAAHGMLAELQAALGAATGEGGTISITTQNVVASAYTMLSPMRVAMAAAALGLIGQEAAIVRKLAPFAIAVLVVGWVAIAFS
jgi:lactate permease